MFFSPFFSALAAIHLRACRGPPRTRTGHQRPRLEQRAARLRASFCTLLAGVLMGKFRSKRLLGNRDQLKMRLFISYPGCKRQRTHCDDQPFDPVYTTAGSEDSALLSGILAVEEGTTLFLFPHGPKGAPVPITLAPGELLLFRGDCWHAGADYAEKNRRIHFYLTSTLRRREAGRTFY